jgi:membrane protein
MELIDRAQERIQRARERHPVFDHVFLSFQHYGDAQGPANAGNITYFGFLSFFPLLAIGFATVGVVSRVYPDAQNSLITALEDVFPGIIGSDDGQISVSTFEGAVGRAGVIGVVGLLYYGLNLLSAVRSGLEYVFDLVPQDTPSWIRGKLRDATSLGAIGAVLMVSVAASTFATGLSDQVREALGLDQVPGTGAIVSGVGIMIGIASSTVLFLALFKLLADPDVPLRALRNGALFSALAFELLKQVAGTLLGFASRSPAAAIFGSALILLIWINYSARIALLGASWAETSPLTVAARAATAEAEALEEAEQMLQVRWGPSVPDDEPEQRPAAAAIVGSAAALAAITLLLRRALRE